MNNFADRLITQIKLKHSCLIVGLDPRWDLIPKALSIGSKKPFQVLFDFNRAVIDLVADKVVGVKPQSAFYEYWGYQGIKVFWETIKYAKKKGLITIGDVKRGDVPATAQAYAEAYLDRGQNVIDAITVNPFLGKDSLEPFIKLSQKNGQGLFILVKTSNRGSNDFQDQFLRDGSRFYEFLAKKVARWGKKVMGKNGYSAVGAVVGATFPAAARKLRQLMPEQFFLVPGVGTQGGQIKKLYNYFNQDGLGTLVTAARSLVYVTSPDDPNWHQAIRQAVDQLNQEIWNLLASSSV